MFRSHDGTVISCSVFDYSVFSSLNLLILCNFPVSVLQSPQTTAEKINNITGFVELSLGSTLGLVYGSDDVVVSQACNMYVLILSL